MNEKTVNSGNEEISVADNIVCEAEANTMQEDLLAMQSKCTELSDQFLRAKAEVENARRRAEDDVLKARKYALESFAQSLLPVMDSLEAGLQVNDATIDQILEGTKATLRQLVSALERNKIEAISPETGVKFDPHFHQAISMVPSEQEPNSVVSVLQKGYCIFDRVLRPALVTVASAIDAK
jgi:molecular chaperone GrpE